MKTLRVTLSVTLALWAFMASQVQAQPASSLPGEIARAKAAEAQLQTNITQGDAATLAAAKAYADTRPGPKGDSGPPGKDGAPGAPGVGATVAVEPPGENCVNGGAKITGGSGPAVYVCNGSGAAATCPLGTCSVGGSPCKFDRDCAAGACQAPTPRFVDNGNLTVTDRQTCLMWEKKTGTVGVLAACPDPAVVNCAHDVNRRYRWPFTDFLAQLNGAAFAGHSDWRLPTSAGIPYYPTGNDPELESILLAGGPFFADHQCGTNPCIDPLFGPTTPNWYSTANLFLYNSRYVVWSIQFANGHLEGVDIMTDDGPVYYWLRAVRSGP